MLPVGELAALSCSFLWAACSLAFASAGRRVGAAGVNQLRIYIALLALFALHPLVVGPWVPSGISERQLTTLALSGLAGLALGDYFLFRSMTVVGPRIGTLLMASSPVFTALLAWVAFDETILLLGVLGMAVTLAGVVLVLVDRRAVEGWQASPGDRRALAVAFGFLGALGQSAGFLLTRHGMAAVGAEEVTVPAFSVTLVRMAAAASILTLTSATFGGFGAVMGAVRDRLAFGQIAIGAVFGPILGVWMSVVAVHHAKAGIAATLMSLAPVLMLPIGRIAYGSRPGALGFIGTLVAVGGATLLVLR
ncbi:MAG: DMT family transporter [Planctomycetota bacterium]|jgi:drug/metabolite transporter (DMT)-like permease